MVVLIDAKYVGTEMAHARKCAKIKRSDAARMLGVSYCDLRHMERGSIVIPEATLIKLFRYGYLMLYARRGNIAKHAT